MLVETDKQKLFKAPETAGTVMEALQQRLAKYKEAEEQAKQAGDSSKMKRHGRIVKVSEFSKTNRVESQTLYY
jgi:hypothetical protein